MSLALLTETLADLPASLRQQIEGYAASVAESAPEIFRTAGVRRSDALRDQLVFLAGLRRLWTLVNSHYWLLDRSLEMADQTQGERIVGISVGSRVLTRNEGDLLELRQLRENIRAAFEKEGLTAIVRADSLRDVLVLITG